MRYEAVGPDAAALALLARVDELAAAAVVAIEQGDDAELIALLDQRGRVVEATIAAWQAASMTAPPEVLARMAAAAQVSLRIGQEARAVATRVRDQVSTELSQLEARQSASHEYQQGPARSEINVVL
jgi:hypothetical protein